VIPVLCFLQAPLLSPLGHRFSAPYYDGADRAPHGRRSRHENDNAAQWRGVVIFRMGGSNVYVYA